MTEQERLAHEFMERHGHAVMNALRHMVDYWREVDPEAVPMAGEQVESWRGVLADAERVVEGE